MIKFILIYLFISNPLINCNELYKSLCTPSFVQIKDLIKHAYAIKNPNSSLVKWTYEMNLQHFCELNDFESDKLPDSIKVSKFPANIEDNVDILLTIRVPISKFYVDENEQTDHKYWLLYKWPFVPFHCPICRSFLTYSTKKSKKIPNNISFIYGIMQNRYPSIVDPEEFETIKREVKKQFFEQEFAINKKQVIENRSLDEEDCIVNLALADDDETKIIINSTLPDDDTDKIKKTIYVNISTFVPTNKYFLVGMNIENLDGIFSTVNQTTSNRSRRSKRETINTKLLMINNDEFYLEYNLCYTYNLATNLYLPTPNCYPLFVDDQLRHQNADESLAIADCVCWKSHQYKCEI